MSGTTVRQALASPVLRGARPVVLAGAAGLDASVRWVHTTELVDIAPLLRAGDLLLSTGIALPDSEAGLTSFAESLASSGAAGLLIELGRRWSEIPHPLVQACDRLALPLVALTREVRFAAVAQALGEQIVDSQLTELRDATRVHDVFTELSVAEAGPEEILDAVQQLSGAAVVIEDAAHRVVDYRSGPQDVGPFLADWTARSRDVVLDARTTWDQAQGWLLTAVGRHDRGWGRLVVDSPNLPAQRLVVTAERAAAALALHRLHDRQRDSLTRRRHHELLLQLLGDPGRPEVQRRVELAGVPLRDRTLVGLALRPGPAADSPVSTRGEAAVAAVVHAAHEMRMPALVAEVEGTVRVLLSCPPAQDATAATDDIAARAARRVALVAGAGRPVDRPGLVGRTLQEALHVVDAVREGHTVRAVHRLEDVHLRGLLTMLAEDGRLQAFAVRELGPLIEHDARTRAGLLDVVRSLLRHPASKSDAAAALHLSRSAFYDRLARVEQVLQVDLGDPEVLASLHVALLATEVAGPAPTTSG